jgi:hypothetical protein
MLRTSSTRLTTASTQSKVSLASSDDTQLPRAELCSQLQDCARRKDWPALQNVLTAYPATYEPDGTRLLQR